MNSINNVNNPYGLVQQAGKRRTPGKRRTHKKKRTHKKRSSRRKTQRHYRR